MRGRHEFASFECRRHRRDRRTAQDHVDFRAASSSAQESALLGTMLRQERLVSLPRARWFSSLTSRIEWKKREICLGVAIIFYEKKCFNYVRVFLILPFYSLYYVIRDIFLNSSRAKFSSKLYTYFFFLNYVYF